MITDLIVSFDKKKMQFKKNEQKKKTSSLSSEHHSAMFHHRIEIIQLFEDEMSKANKMQKRQRRD